MKKSFLIIIALLLLSGAGAAAQTIMIMDEPVMGTGYYRGPVHYRWGNFYDMYGNRVYAQSLYDFYGVSLYGSRYIRAKNEYSWGIGLTEIGALSLAFSITSAVIAAGASAEMQSMGFDSSVSDAVAGLSVVGAVLGGVAVGIGIPLWIGGNRKLMNLADDFNSTFGPRYSSRLDFGSTPSGVGLSLSF